MGVEILPLLELGILGLLLIMAVLVLIYSYLSTHKKNKNEYTEEEE